jgi:hypothetical protein
MALAIGDETITSDRTTHTARTVADEEHRWEVSWLPSRHLDRNSAITAMMLADLTGYGHVRAGHRLWAHVEGWAAELGLDAPDILTEIARQRGREDADRTALTVDPEAAG